jgi:neutral trehalase
VHDSCIPSVADLNAFLLSKEENIADFAAVLGCADVEQRFRQLAANRRAGAGGAATAASNT